MYLYGSDVPTQYPVHKKGQCGNKKDCLRPRAKMESATANPRCDLEPLKIHQRAHRSANPLLHTFSVLQGPFGLGSAITRFEQHAKTIQSEWRFKPRAESDVIPYRTEYQSAKREEFLAVEVALDEKVSANLKECLLAKIKPVYECVKKDEKYTVGDEKARDISVQTQCQIRLQTQRQNLY